MSENIINQWNSVVTNKNSVVFIIGDISLGNEEKSINALNRLNGNKILIAGNHDYKVSSKVLNCFSEVHNYLEIQVYDTYICLFHYPIAIWNKRHFGSWMLHGHLHSRKTNISGKIFNVGIDNKEYDGVVISYSSLEKILKKKDIIKAE